MSIKSLIERLESATEGSREFDGEISLIVRKRYGDAPYYTYDIESALKLVPDGWWANIQHGTDRHCCMLQEIRLPCRRIPDEWPYFIEARTTPIAICIATLKTRVFEEGERSKAL